MYRKLLLDCAGRGAPKILDFPAELYKKALKVLEARSNRPSELGRIMDEREPTDRAQDPSRGGVVVEKRRKHPKKMKKAKNPEKLRDVPSSQSHDPLPRVAAPVPLAPIPLPTIVSPTSPPHPSSSTDPSLRTKRAAPVEADSNRNVRPRLDNSIPLAPTRAPVDMGYNLEQQSFLADFVGNHRSTVQELQEERGSCSALSLGEGSLATGNSLRERTKELEQWLALRPPMVTDSEEFLHLEEENRRLRASEDHLREELKRRKETFEAIQSNHEEVLRRNDRNCGGKSSSSNGGRKLWNLSCARLECRWFLQRFLGPKSFKSDRELLILERNIALMLRQLDLPGFINRFEQRVTEPVFRLYNLLSVSGRSRRGRFSS
ncbi:hypothetical protein BDP27DRAFT_1366313, partial [Rhodocollybia butyracea]